MEKIRECITKDNLMVKKLAIIQKICQKKLIKKERIDRTKRFLTMEEYREESKTYTKKALDDMRMNILKSPKNIYYAKILSDPLK